MHLGKKPFENIVGKGEIACTGNVSFSHDVFYSIKAEIIIFVPCSLSSANTFNLVLVQILVRGNGLRVKSPLLQDTSDPGHVINKNMFEYC